MLKTIKFAVVGTGWVAGEYIKAISSLTGAELYAIVSENKQRAYEKLATYQLQAKVLSDYETAVRDPNIDAVVLCSTPDKRVDQMVAAAQNGKHIVIEKPLAMNREDLSRIQDANEKWPVHSVASFVLRWNHSFQNTRALIQDDAIGRPFLVNVDYWHHVGPQYGQFRWSKTRESGGSSMLSAGCHAVDAIRFFAGDITEVTAYSCSTWHQSDYEFDPNAVAIFKLKNGGVGKISSSLECKTPYRFNVHILGEKGAIMNNQLFTHKLPGQTDFATIPTILPDSGDVSHHPFTQEIENFITSLRNQTSSLCSIADACKSMEACFAIDESIKSGKSVKLP